MYLVDRYATDANGVNYVQSLIKQAREHEVNIKSELIHKEEKEPRKNLFNEDIPIVENTPVEELEHYNNHIVVYNQSLNNLLEEIIKHHKFIPAKNELKYKGFNCTYMHYTRNKQNIHIYSDPNEHHKITWKDVKAICEKTNVEFRNQSIAALVAEIRKRFEKAERHTTERRKEIRDDNATHHRREYCILSYVEMRRH
jgi:hypothetical protein